MALLIHSLVHGLLKTRQRTTLEVTLLIKISEAPCQYSTKNILITSSKLLESQHTESAVSGSLSSNPVFLQTWSPTQKHLPYPVSGARDTSGAAESQGSPQLSPGDPTARPCSGLSGGGRLAYTCGESRGGRERALPERASLQYEPVGVVLVWSSQQKLCHTLHRRGLWGRGCADVFSWQSYPWTSLCSPLNRERSLVVHTANCYPRFVHLTAFTYTVQQTPTLPT